MKETISRRGFTLNELLVVITIVAVLAAIMVHAIRSRAQSQCTNNMRKIASAWLTYCDDYEGRTAPYCDPYAPDFTEAPMWHTILPWKGSTVWKTGLMGSYLESEKVAWCPAFQPIMSNSDDYPGTYGYNGFYLVWNGVAQEWSKLNAGKSLVTKSMIQVPAKTICFIDSRDGWASSPFTQQYNQPAWSMTASADRHNIGWNVSFCDGHVKWYSSNWQSPIVSNDYLWAVNKRNFSK